MDALAVQWDEIFRWDAVAVVLGWILFQVVQYNIAPPFHNGAKNLAFLVLGAKHVSNPE